MAPLDDNPQPLIHPWRDLAACAGQPVSWWFPDRRKNYRHQPGIAEAICKGCPVRTECVAAGLKEPEGIWGGVLKSTRRRV
jgi:hypothetical protein